MNSVATSPATEASWWTSPSVLPAILTLIGVIVALIVRDVVMAIYLSRRKRLDDIADKKDTETRNHRDMVRLYADPLREAATSLKFRLHEIVEKKQARYLHSNAPNTPFLEYKKLSTLYRIAALLGWIRAIRRERGYLDPQRTKASSEMESIAEFESALADGTHVELQRLEELLSIWRVRSNAAPKITDRVASLIDGERADYLARKGVLGARDLSNKDQIELAKRCADIVTQYMSADIPQEIIAATADQASLIFGIKEAYIYRDWQAAIGDLMLVESKEGTRHFSILGFGAFEDWYLNAHRENEHSSARRWFDRLQAIFHDLDMEREGMFDARREQIRKLYQCCLKLEAALELKGE